MDIMTFTLSLCVMYPGENDFVIFIPDRLKINLPTVAIEPIFAIFSFVDVGPP